MIVGGAGFLLGDGDTLQFSWLANGGAGPGVNFTLFAHSATTHEALLNATGVRDTGSLAVGGTLGFLAVWTNPSAASVNVTYSFQAIPPPGDALILGALGVFGLLALGAGWAVYRAFRAEEKAPPEPSPPKP